MPACRLGGWLAGKERLGNRITVKTEMDGNLDGHTYARQQYILYTRDDEQAGTNIEQQSNKQLSSFSVCLPVVLVFPGSSAYKQSWSVNLSSSSGGTQSDCIIYCKQTRDGRTDRHTDGAQGTTASLLLLSRHNDSLRPTHTA